MLTPEDIKSKMSRCWSLEARMHLQTNPPGFSLKNVQSDIITEKDTVRDEERRGRMDVLMESGCVHAENAEATCTLQVPASKGQFSLSVTC